MMTDEEDTTKLLGQIVNTLNAALIRLDGIEKLMQLSLFSQRNEVMSDAFELLESSKKRTEVYLATDGRRTATEIAKITTMKRPNVSIEHKTLLGAGLIEPDHPSGKGHVYRKSRGLELLGLSGIVAKKFGLKYTLGSEA